MLLIDEERWCPDCFKLLLTFLDQVLAKLNNNKADLLPA